MRGTNMNDVERLLDDAEAQRAFDLDELTKRPVMAGYKCSVCGHIFVTAKDMTLLMEHHLIHPQHARLTFKPLEASR